MRKYFVCELKRNRNALIVLTVLCALLAGVVMMNERLFYNAPLYDENWNYIPGKGRVVNYDGGMNFFCGMLIVLCLFAPVYTYAFKMKKRSVDAMYSLPIKREGLYFVKSLIGLLLVFVPYTVAYLTGVSVVLVRENYFALGWYAPFYFASLGLGACLYFTYAFFFTRANTVADGIVFMLAWSFFFELALLLAVQGLNCLGLENWSELIKEHDYLDIQYSLLGGVLEATDFFSSLLGKKNVDFDAAFAQSLAFSVVCGGAACALFFRGLKKEKAENAEQISSSVWGYKFLIPAYVLLCVSNCSAELIVWIIVWIAAIVSFIVYRRSVRLKWFDWASILAGFVLGVLLCGCFTL